MDCIALDAAGMGRQQRLHRRRCLPLHCWRDVAVEVERRADPRVISFRGAGHFVSIIAS